MRILREGSVLRPAEDGGGLVSQGNDSIVLVNFNATAGTDRDGYQSFVGPHDSGSREIMKAPQCSLTLRKIG